MPFRMACSIRYSVEINRRDRRRTIKWRRSCVQLLRVNLDDVRLLLLGENVVEGQETKGSQFVGKAQQIQLHMVHQVVGFLHLKSDFDVRYLHQEFVHHAAKQLQVSDILLLDAHLRQLPRYQVELSHLVVVTVHDGLQLLKLVSAQAADQILQLLQLLWFKRLLLLGLLGIVILGSYRGLGARRLRASLREGSQNYTCVKKNCHCCRG